MKPNKRKSVKLNRFLLERIAAFNGADMDLEHGFCDNSSKPYVLYLLCLIAGAFLGMIWFVGAFGMA